MQSGACDAPLHFPLNPHHKHQNHQSKQYCLSPNLQKTPSGLSELSGSVVNKKTASQTPKPPIEAVQCLSKPSKTPSGLSELSGSVVNKKNCITIAKIVHRSNTAVSTSLHVCGCMCEAMHVPAGVCTCVRWFGACDARLH
jgi:hypothetical protein